ncbi:MAG: U32 family peptidase [Muribaculaceae bacterium]|nr:U32 family peptidase [Muribaculaceae bacterium]
MEKKGTRIIELLAPARNAEIAMAAIDHGADAVYIGASHHGARHAAGNSIDDIKRVVEYARPFGVNVYVTLNTIVYDNEIDEVKSLVGELYRAGVDALIVQDMALLEMDLPPIALHASTQCDIRTPERAQFLQDAGMSQLVLARELTIDEIKAIRQATTVPLEAFVHGALCVSYSGNCQASHIITGRSANRGECAQMCRLPYTLIDGDGRAVVTDKHLLSLRDMNRIESLGEMIDAGIDSFKIEGRLKDADYVKTVVSAYSDRLDRIIAERGDGLLRRRGRGRVTRTFSADLADSFNRGYTDYFLHHRRPNSPMASINTPKSAGQPIGKVRKAMGRTLIVDTTVQLANGDGLTYFDAAGKLQGFRVNRVEADGKRIQLAAPVDIHPGSRLYRNHDIQRETMMARTTARRVIDVDMTLRTIDDGRRLALDISLTNEPRITATAAIDVLDGGLQAARSPQADVRQRTLAKLGDTMYDLAQLDDRVDAGSFIPLSLLTTLRRQATDLLDRTLRLRAMPQLRQPSAVGPQLGRPTLDYTDNVANSLSANFYRRAGATDIEPAIECQKADGRQRRVMLTRYCIRRELGYCLKTPRGKQLKEPLTLRGAGFDYTLHFDCHNCEMSLFTRF